LSLSLPKRVSSLVRGISAMGLGWGLADQSLSSLTNFACALLVARTAGVKEFGIFSVAFATYTLGLGISRAVTGEPLIARFGRIDEPEWHGVVRASTGAALLLGIAFGVICIFLALTVFDGSLGTTTGVLGLTFPGLMLQDAWRYAFFASPRNRRAFSNDLVWTVLLALGLLLVLRGERHSASQFTLIWGLSATGAALVGIAQGSVIPRISDAPRWIREQLDLGMRFLGEFLALMGSTQLMLYGLAFVSGVSAVGALRAGLVVMGPLNILLMGVNLVAVPEAARMARVSSHTLWKFCVALSVGLAGAAIVWGSIAILLPESIGRFVLGPTWEPARATLFPVTLWIAGNGVIAGAVVGLRGLQAASRSLRAQLTTASSRLILGLVGGAMAGASGAAWGVALGILGTSAIWWHQLSKVIAERGITKGAAIERGASDTSEARRQCES
jgi:O-antigen/teichoic acid export membrane protein